MQHCFTLSSYNLQKGEIHKKKVSHYTIFKKFIPCIESQCTLGYQPPFKNTTPLFLAKPPLNLQTLQAPPFLGNSSCIGFFVNPPKNWIFQ